MAGAAECWNSPDGEFWTKRGIPAPNDPHTNRMNVAAGLAKNGDLLVLCSGWTDVKQPQRPKQAVFRDDILSTWVCRSSDGGKTWSQIKEFPAPDAGWTNYIPFGDIKQRRGRRAARLLLRRRIHRSREEHQDQRLPLLALPQR